MLRFSDRLSSSTAAAQDVLKLAVNSSDEASGLAGEDTRPAGDSDYNNLVELLGLHQTVKILEAEYRLVAGANSHSSQKNLFKDGYALLICDLIENTADSKCVAETSI